ILDKLILAYFGVNLKVVWLSVKEGIPEAKPDIKHILDEMSIESEIPHDEKESVNLKKPCKVPLIKLKKSRVFQFLCSYHYLNKRFRGRFKQTAGRKNMFQMNCLEKRFFILYSAVQFWKDPTKTESGF
ncbi:MAG: hypothetical protein AB7U72_04975, partial [Methanosarcina sp.]